MINGDVKLRLVDGQGVLTILGDDLEGDPGLETAVLISLFTDARATDEDVLPDNSGDRRGWWADNELGSKLWLLGRSKNTPDLPERISDYCRKALQWMIDEGVAKYVNVSVTSKDRESQNFVVDIVKPSGDKITFRYGVIWDNQLNPGA